VKSLQEQVATLERRLHDGYDRIEKAKKDGQDATAWEDFWLSLLNEYEQLYDKLWGRA
jgi:hypothetical protein